MSILSKPQRGEFTGRHMLLLAIGFFGVIISVNVGLAVVSATSWTGLVVDNSYVASQQFEEKRIAHEAQLAAGWNATLAYSSGLITLKIVDAKGNPVDLGVTKLQINRPVGGHDDHRTTLAQGADGTYSAAVDLGPGVWESMVTAPDTALGPFVLHERFKVDGATP